MRHVISALVVNEPGVLASVAGMFAARGFNIDSLVVGRTEDPNLSRMTIVVDADENTLEQVRKQLAKLVPITQVKDFKDSAYVERDLALVAVATRPEHRNEVIEIVTLFRGKVVDVAKESMMVELSGTEQKIEAFVELDEALRNPRAGPHRHHRHDARHAGEQGIRATRKPTRRQTQAKPRCPLLRFPPAQLIECGV